MQIGPFTVTLTDDQANFTTGTIAFANSVSSIPITMSSTIFPLPGITSRSSINSEIASTQYERIINNFITSVNDYYNGDKTLNDFTSSFNILAFVYMSNVMVHDNWELSADSPETEHWIEDAKDTQSDALSSNMMSLVKNLDLYVMLTAIISGKENELHMLTDVISS